MSQRLNTLPLAAAAAADDYLMLDGAVNGSRRLLVNPTGTGKLVFGTAPTIIGGSITALTSFGVRSISAAFDLILASTEALTANRTLTIAMGDAARTLTFIGNPTLADWFDQSVKTTASPAFAAVSLNGGSGGVIGLKQTSNSFNGGFRTIRQDNATYGTVYMGGDDNLYIDNRSAAGGIELYGNGTRLGGIRGAGGSVDFPGGIFATTIGLGAPAAGSFTAIALDPFAIFAASASALRFRGTAATSTLQGYDGANAYGITLFNGATPGVILQSNGLSSFAGGVGGTPTNDNAVAGAIGEYIQSILDSSTPFALTSGTLAHVTSLTLTPGDWDVTGVIGYVFGATTVASYYIGGIDIGGGGLEQQRFTFASGISSASVSGAVPIPTFRVSVAVSTVVYLTTQCEFTTSTLSAFGGIRARRVR